MAIVDFNLDPTERQLKQFGGVCVLALPLIAWLWTRNFTTVGWAAGVGVLLCGLGLAAPRLLKPIFIALIIITIPIGFVVGELAMLLIWFGVFLPLAVVFRMMGRDSLNRRCDDKSETFWQKRSAPAEVRRYYRQW